MIIVIELHSPLLLLCVPVIALIASDHVICSLNKVFEGVFVGGQSAKYWPQAIV